MKSRFSLILQIVLLFSLVVSWSAGVQAGVLLQEHHLIYEGAFRVPRGNLGGESEYPQTLARGGAGLTYNPTNNSLIMISRPTEALAVEISIPIPLSLDNISELNTATLVQSPGDIADSQWAFLGINHEPLSGPVPAGLLVYHDKIIGSAHIYYDGSNQAARSHFKASIDWTTNGSQFSGMHRIGLHPTNPIANNGGFVGGYMAHIPSSWQTLFGYPALTGQGSLGIVSRTSYGPSAWGFDPNNLGIIDPTPATFLVGYPEGHTTLGMGDVSLYYNRVTELRGLVFPENSDSIIFFGRHGLGMTGEGDICYGSGTDDLSLHGTPDGQGNIYCYDPVDGSKGVHGYPYISQAWFYNANDLLDVKNGLKEPWEVLPYARWEINLPFPTASGRIVGAAYDPSSQRIFLAQHQADNITNVYEPYPIIHVFSLDLAAAPQAAPLVEPEPQPAPTPEPPPVLRMQ